MTPEGKRKAREKKIEDALKKKDNRILIGEMLRRRRDELDISQREIGERIGYANLNFISMIENGVNSMPLARIHDFVDAYKLEPVLAGAFVKLLYPDAWHTFCALNEALGEIMDSLDYEVLIDSAYAAALKEFRIAV